jgi:hypothetical protein
MSATVIRYLSDEKLMKFRVFIDRILDYNVPLFGDVTVVLKVNLRSGSVHEFGRLDLHAFGSLSLDICC